MKDSTSIIVPARSNFASEEDVHFQVFLSWDQATSAGYRTSKQWRKCGRGVKGRSFAMIYWRDRECKLYHESQTTQLTPRTMAKHRLLDRFVARDDVFGYQPHRTNEWRQMHGDVRDVKKRLSSGFNHRRCFDEGIRFGRIRAQAFSIRCGERASFVVIDLDNHHPSSGNIPAHLELVELVQAGLPGLNSEFGGGSYFSQYRQPDPTGIQFWVTIGWSMRTAVLHSAVRNFLLGLEAKSPGLNDRLRAVGLPDLGGIEIVPTQGKQVSMPGCLGKVVFTTQELRLIDGKFDVQALDTHISSENVTGNVLPRYRELMEVCWGDLPPAGGQVSSNVTEPACTILSMDSQISDGKRYWTDLKRIALDGVTTPDDLYGAYLQPLAQCLYFRDFVHEPDRERLVEEELFDWVIAKHNDLVSRIRDGKIDDVRRQCRQVARTIEDKTCDTVKKYYRNILTNDLLYPHRTEKLYEIMRRNAGAKENTISLIYCKCSNSDRFERPFDETSLPAPISDSLSAVSENMRKGKVQDRFLTFARRFLNELVQKGEASISWQRINKMIGIGEVNNRQTQGRYKKLLVQAGLIKSGWEKFARRGACSSKYRLTEWAFDEFRKERGNTLEKSA